MRIYFGHSTWFDYLSDFYAPIKRSTLCGRHECVFPHEDGKDAQREKTFYKTIDLFVAEVSLPSTGLGIELGWAKDVGCRIVCVHKADMTPSFALRSVCDEIWSYGSEEELVGLIERAALSTTDR